MYISTPSSSEVENFQMKIYHPAGDNPGPAEPEADMLPSEPARRAVPFVLHTRDIAVE